MDAATTFTLTSVFRLAAPEAALVLASFVVFLAGATRPNKAMSGGLALLSFLAAFALLVFDRPDLERLTPTVSPLWPDGLAFFTRVVALAGGIVLLFVSWDEVEDGQAAEFFACLMVLSAGTALVGSATELITLFLALEMISIPTYVMLYLARTGRGVQEAAVKYFLLSIFSSALLLFGFSYLYGITGTTNLPAIHEALARGEVTPIPGLLLIAVVMVVAGLGFRLTAVPFHFYAPDVYQGAANGPAALLAFVPKVAGAVALIRLFGWVGPGAVAGTATIVDAQLPLLLWILAAVTMTVGNIVAVWQVDLKRMLAYSSIAHAGYILMGLAAAPYLAPQTPGGDNVGIAAVLFYLPAYGAMTIGAFAVLQAVSSRDRAISSIDELAGLGQSHPGLAMLMALFLFSLIGLPLTAGFTGKFMLFTGALSVQGHTNPWLFRVLAVIAAVNAAVAAFYYLRVIGVMYLRTALHPLPGRAGIAGLIGLWLCAGVTIWLGCYPPRVVEFARATAVPKYPVHHLRSGK